MTSNDNFISNRQVIETLDGSVKSENLLDTKLQDIGCCGDVPNVAKTNKKRDKLLEWLKSSQLKREENNRQVFSRWIDMVDNGAIDLSLLSNYPGKSSKQVTAFSNLNTVVTNPIQVNCDSSLSQVDSVINVSPQISKALFTNSVKSTAIPTTNICPTYFPPINNSNYYGLSQNWFSGNQQTGIYSPLHVSQQMPVGIYPGFGSFCTTSPIMGNYYQYVPVQQTCALCPPYIIPTVPSNMETNYSLSTIPLPSTSSSDNSSSSVNIDVNKWFDVLNEIKLDQPVIDNNNEDNNFLVDPNDSNNCKNKP